MSDERRISLGKPARDVKCPRCVYVHDSREPCPQLATPPDRLREVARDLEAAAIECFNRGPGDGSDQYSMETFFYDILARQLPQPAAAVDFEGVARRVVESMGRWVVTDFQHGREVPHETIIAHVAERLRAELGGQQPDAVLRAAVRELLDENPTIYAGRVEAALAGVPVPAPTPQSDGALPHGMSSETYKQSIDSAWLAAQPAGARTSRFGVDPAKMSQEELNLLIQEAAHYRDEPAGGGEGEMKEHLTKTQLGAMLTVERGQSLVDYHHLTIESLVQRGLIRKSSKYATFSYKLTPAGEEALAMTHPAQREGE